MKENTKDGATQIDDGGQAFPCAGFDGPDKQEPGNYEGMTLRDYFAGQVVSSMYYGLAKLDMREIDTHRICARNAYAIADAMLAARKTGG